LADARTALGRIDEWLRRLSELAGETDRAATPLSSFVDAFFAALDDDLNISGALGHLFELITESNKALDAETMPRATAAELLEGWNRINQVLALEPTIEALPDAVRAFIAQRDAARAANICT
jgi:cysteinyl-tRNA synthetase